MNQPTREEVLASIVPRSDQLNSDDLIATGPITVTVTKVTKGSKDQPINVHIDGGYQPFRPCKTCRRILIAIWSNDSSKWVGQKLTIFTDPSVLYAGIKVGGLRISGMSGLDNPRTFMLTTTRGKKSETTIRPIKPETSPEDNAYIVETRSMIANVSTLEELANLGEMLKDKSAPIQEALRGPYSARQKELKQAASDSD